MLKRNLFTIILVLIALATGIGSIVAKFNSTIGIFLIILGVIVGAYQIVADTMKHTALIQMIDTQNTLLASAGMGNVYLKLVESELYQKGKSPNAIALLKKGYDLDNNNIEVIKQLSVSMALYLSRIGWVRGISSANMKNNRDWIFVKEVAERGLQINPKERILMDTLGNLYDTAGEHEIARDWFFRSSKFRNDPYWHFLVATSWGMSGKTSEAIAEIDLAIKEGATGWLTYLLYGDTLQNWGRPQEALSQLTKARKTRGMHLLNSYASLYARATIGCFSVYSIIDWLYATASLIMTGYWHTLRRVTEIQYIFLSSILSSLSLSIWFVTSRNRLSAKIHCNIISPDWLAFFRGYEQLRLGDYKSALNFFQTCRSVCPKSVEVLGNLALCYALLGDRRKAIELIDEALFIEPNNQILLWDKQQYESTGELHPRFS